MPSYLNKKQLGARGELLARRYLIKNGYQILAANYRLGRKEIDLIARKNKKLIFIEVKTRIKTPGSLFDNHLTPAQTRRLKQAISVYCFKNHWPAEMTRLDLIVILVHQNIGHDTDRATDRADLQHYDYIF